MAERNVQGEPKLPFKVVPVAFFVVIEGLSFFLYGPSRLAVAYQVLPMGGSQ